MNQSSVSAARVKVLSPGHFLIGYIDHDDAVLAVRLKKATVVSKTRNRLRAVIDISAKVGARIPSAAAYTYREQLSDTMSTTMLLRFTASRGFVLWDPHLTFSELREGRIDSKVTQDLQQQHREQKAFQKAIAVA